MSNRKNNRKSRRAARTAWAGLAAALLAGTAHAQPTTLVTGKNISLPPLGVQTPVGSLPMNMIATPDGRFAITSDMGYHQLLTVLDTTTGRQISSLEFGNPATRSNPGLFFGLAVTPAAANGTYTLYAAQGNNHTVAVLTISPVGNLTQTGTIVMPFGDFPAGVALDTRGNLYVAVSQSYNGTLSDALTPSSLVAYNVNTTGTVTPGTVVPTNAAHGTPAPETARYYFGALGTASRPAVAAAPAPGSTPDYPYAVAVSPKNNKLYVASERDDAVFVFDTTNPATIAAQTPAVISSGAATGTQAHPISLLLSADESALYVAYAHADGIAVVSTASGAVVKTLSLRPDAFLPAGAAKTAAAALPGVTPNGLALSPDGQTLFVALGDMNAVAVVSLASGTLTGYIPAGWYPSTVLAAPYKRLLVANAKGTSTRNPNPAFKYQGGNGDPNYGEYLTVGSVSLLPQPNSVQLRADTQQVLANNRLAEIGAHPAVFDQIGLKAAGITHVIYIVKENRTYDQVLGDVPAGNGDPALTLFGASVTPNQHALAERFVLLDNFYDCGEVSGDGWPWSTQGIANEYVIKNLPYNYSGRGRNYDYEGSNNNYPTGGFPAADPYGNPLVGPDSPFCRAGRAAPSPTSPRPPAATSGTTSSATACPSATTAPSPPSASGPAPARPTTMRCCPTAIPAARTCGPSASSRRGRAGPTRWPRPATATSTCAATTRTSPTARRRTITPTTTPSPRRASARRTAPSPSRPRPTRRPSPCSPSRRRATTRPPAGSPNSSARSTK